MICSDGRFKIKRPEPKTCFLAKALIWRDKRATFPLIESDKYDLAR